ncbi:MAG: hypothetical protein ACD_54C00683G0001 [uncultured bacterium]|nr:MAG: hypothetical protein ACD_54C00683G0001 [uncultured bacterium]
MPGQAMISDNKPTLAVASPICASAACTAGRSDLCTCGRMTFCSWLMRRSLWPYFSARSAISRIWSLVASPGVWPWALMLMVTMAYWSLRWAARLVSAQARNTGSAL